MSAPKFQLVVDEDDGMPSRYEVSKATPSPSALLPCEGPCPEPTVHEFKTYRDPPIEAKTSKAWAFLIYRCSVCNTDRVYGTWRTDGGVE